MALQVYNHPRRATPRRSSATQTHAAYTYPAPMRGLDLSQPITGGLPGTALRLDNLIPRSLGCELRAGYRRWRSNVASGRPLISLMPYYPASRTVEPKLFAADDLGKVYDVSTFDPDMAPGPPVLNVPGGQPPGEWTSFNYTVPAGTTYLIAVNPGGGYWSYDGTTWKQYAAGTGPGAIDGADPHSFTFATVYKTQLCFTQMGTTDMWVLPTGEVSGKVTKVSFGSLLPSGGELVGLVNWTFDGSNAGQSGVGGGGGMDSKLVVIASQGDVLVWSGGDVGITTTNFVLSGRWYVGRVPVGHRFFSQYSGDVGILSERGLCFMSELMRGEGFYPQAQAAGKINSEVAAEVSKSLQTPYWEVKFLPHEQLMLVKLPMHFENTERQWAYEVNTKAFCGLLGIPMMTCETWDGKSFSTDDQGNVWWLLEGESDGENNGVAGTDLQGMMVTTFQPLGENVRLKRFLMVRPSFISTSAPGFQVKLNPEWNMRLPEAAPAYLGQGESFWDTGTWDYAVWSGEASAYQAWVGVTGTGRYGALSMRVRGAAGTTFLGWAAVVEAGGIL